MKAIQDMLREWDRLDIQQAKGMAKAAFLPQVKTVKPDTETAQGQQ